MFGAEVPHAVAAGGADAAGMHGVGGDPVANGEPGDLGPDRDDRARAFVAEDHRQLDAERVPAQVVDVRGADRGRPGPDQHLVGPGRGWRDVDEVEPVDGGELQCFQ